MERGHILEDRVFANVVRIVKMLSLRSLDQMTNAHLQVKFYLHWERKGSRDNILEM